jgi:hypothetical protein
VVGVRKAVVGVRKAVVGVRKAVVGVPTDHSLNRVQQLGIQPFSSLATTK